MLPFYFNSFQYSIAISVEYWNAEHYMKIVHILSFSGLYSVQVRKNTDQKNLNMLEFTHKYNKTNPTSIYLLKVNNRNTKTRCEICSKLIIKTLDTLNMQLPAWKSRLAPLVLN